MLTLQLIENPVRFAARLRPSAVASLAVGGAATAAAVCVGVALLVWMPAPVGRSLPGQALTITAGPPLAGGNVDQYNRVVQSVSAQVQAGVAASAALEDVPSNLDPPLADAAAEEPLFYVKFCMRNVRQVEQPECATGDTASPTTVALVGDSNAAMWAPGFERVATQRHWRLQTLTKSGCPLLTLPNTITIASGRKYTECYQWRGQLIARLQAEHPRLIVLTLWRRYGDSDPAAWIDSMTRSVRQLRGTGAQVLVLGPIPDPQSEVPNCLSVHLEDATTCSPLRSVAVNEPAIAAEAAAVKAGGGQYADLTELFCTAERCPVIIGNTLVYFDRKHTTMEYARLLAPALGALADRALVGG
jgi:hypothetical protein